MTNGSATTFEYSSYILYIWTRVGLPCEVGVMIQRLRKVGNSYVVTIPKDEVERLELQEGQLLSLEITPMEVRPKLRPELKQALDDSWERNEAGYRYLADR
jgi:antitoxin component of MazEF toxin-antitoxin module